MEPTIEEVAWRAGVSTATVSRSLRGQDGVSLATAQRVRHVADEIGYAASPFASRLASGRAGTVAVVLPYLDRWFFGEILGAAEPVFRQAGLDLLLYHVGDVETRREYFSFRLLRKRVDGVLLVTLALTSHEVDALTCPEGPGVHGRGRSRGLFQHNHRRCERCSQRRAAFVEPGPPKSGAHLGRPRRQHHVHGAA